MYLILCDPSGAYCARFIERGVSPDDIYVYEDTYKGTVCSESRGVHVITDLDDLKDMQFDVVLGNPPYQDSNAVAGNNKLWHKLVTLSLEHLKDDGVLNLITPDSIVSSTGWGKKFHALCSSDLDLTLIDYTADRHFDVGVTICRWVVHKRPYRGVTRIVHADGEFTHDLRDGLPLYGDKLLISTICDKILNSTHERLLLTLGQSIAKADYTDDGEHEVCASGDEVRRTDVTPTTPYGLKLVVPYSRSYKSAFVTELPVGLLNTFTMVESVEEGQRLVDLFSQPIVRFFCDHYDKTAGFCPAVKKSKVPILTTTDDIQQQFGLTDDEYKYVLQNA